MPLLLKKILPIYVAILLLALTACAPLSQQQQYEQAVLLLDQPSLNRQGLVLLQQAAQRGYGPAAYDLARIYRQLWLGDNSTTCPAYEYWLEKAHEQGETSAIPELLEYYKFYNHPKYLAWYADKADKGDFAAQFETGLLLAEGYGGFKNRHTLSQAWFRQHALAWPGAMLNELAICYQYGYRLEVDLAQAVYWYELAIDKGFYEANTNLGVVYILQSPLPVRDTPKGFAYALEGARQGSGRGMCVVAEAYQWGVGVGKNLRQARQWYEKSSQAGYLPGSYYLGKMLLNGQGGPKDTGLAYELFLRVGASNDNWVNALGYLQIGHIYRQGLGKNKNYQQAMEYYLKAANLGSQRAMYWLGYMYEKGMATSIDRHKAIDWYQRALLEPEPSLHPMRMDQSLSERDIVAEHNKQVYKALARLRIK